MKKTIASLLCVGLGFFAASAMAGESALADRHASMGVTCEKCHQTKAPKAGAKVKNETCFQCHQSYDAMAKRTEKLEPNPHRNHLGNVRCSDCHSGHEQAKLMCNDCHKFNLKMK